MRKGRTTETSDLLELANVGPAIAGHLGKAGVTRTSQLVGRDPVEVWWAYTAERKRMLLVETRR